jgi:nucleoside phosphorylase
MQVKVLIVDDERHKRAKIANVLLEALGDKGVQVYSAATVADAGKILEHQMVHLLVLDLCLPMRKGELARRNGGLQLLHQLTKGNPRLHVPVHLIGLSAFQEIIDESTGEFDREGWSLVQYDATSEEWSTTLAAKAVHIAKSDPLGHYDFDMAILTALKSVELEAVLDLPAKWRKFQLDGDDTYYHEGVFKSNGKSLRVVAAAAIEMGMPAAACLATKVGVHFQPRVLAMAGVTAGIGLNYGDVVVAEQCWDYGSGKIKTVKGNSSFAPAPNYIPLDASIKEKVEHFIRERQDILAEIQNEWAGNSVETKLAVRLGPAASGAAVVESRPVIEEIRRQNRKLIGVEMEAYGMFLAARTMIGAKPIAFSAKAVCDNGVPPKTDEFQCYAAYTSANFIYRFSLDQLT